MAKKQQRSLQYQRQQLHHTVEVPGNDAVESLSVLAAFDGGSSLLSGSVVV